MVFFFLVEMADFCIVRYKEADEKKKKEAEAAAKAAAETKSPAATAGAQ